MRLLGKWLLPNGNMFSMNLGGMLMILFTFMGMKLATTDTAHRIYVIRWHNQELAFVVLVVVSFEAPLRAPKDQDVSSFAWTKLSPGQQWIIICRTTQTIIDGVCVNVVGIRVWYITKIRNEDISQHICFKRRYHILAYLCNRFLLLSFILLTIETGNSYEIPLSRIHTLRFRCVRKLFDD